MLLLKIEISEITSFFTTIFSCLGGLKPPPTPLRTPLQVELMKASRKIWNGM